MYGGPLGHRRDRSCVGLPCSPQRGVGLTELAMTGDKGRKPKNHTVDVSVLEIQILAFSYILGAITVQIS